MLVLGIGVPSARVPERVLGCGSSSVAFAASTATPATPQDFDAATRRVRTLVAELIAAAPVNQPGGEANAVAIGAARLRDAGIPFEVFEFAPGRANLVARLRGSGSEKPLLLLAHVDVIPTAGQPWTVPPHQLTEKGDRLYGRGVLDDLSMAAVELEVLRLLKSAGTPLRRDVIVAWTAGEETGGDGIRWQLQNRPEVLSDAGLALNEGGELRLGTDGKVKEAGVLVAEKTYQDFTLRTKGTTGHSSAPRPDNAIYRLARALDKVAQRPSTPRWLPETRAWFASSAASEEPRMAEAMRAVAAAQGPLPQQALDVIAARPGMAALLRTTCVATQLAAGTAKNVLPAEATANVNCRILPDQSSEEVRLALVDVIGDPAVDVVAVELAVRGKPVPIDGEGPALLRTVLGRLHPGVPVVPKLVNYFTDSRSLTAAGITAYGIGLFPRTDEDGMSMHAADERIPAASLGAGLRLLYEIVLEAAASR